MKIKKPSESTAIDTIATTGGAFVGGMASRGVFGLIHNPDATTDAAQIKKNDNAALLKRAGLAIVGVAAAMCLDGNDAATAGVKGVGLGMAVVQGLEIIASLTKDSSIATNAAAPTATAAQKFAAKSLGLGCPCTGGTLNGKGLRYADIPVYNVSNMDNFAAAPGGNGGVLDAWGSQGFLN